MKRRGFTIIELMMVVAIIAILLTFSVTAVSGVIKNARQQRTNALCRLVEQGLATYYAQFGTWPWTGHQNETKDYYLTESEIKEAIFKLVKESKENNNPMMDISGLYVSTKTGERGSRDRGMDFMTAVKGAKGHPRRTPASQLHYGYPDPETGYFRHFQIKVSPMIDRVQVLRQ